MLLSATVAMREQTMPLALCCHLSRIKQMPFALEPHGPHGAVDKVVEPRTNTLLMGDTAGWGVPAYHGYATWAELVDRDTNQAAEALV